IKSQPNNHAVVAVRHGSHWFVLDNRSLAVVQTTELLDYYVPLLTPDHQGVRQFVVPPNPKVAGLQRGYRLTLPLFTALVTQSRSQAADCAARRHLKFG